MKVKHNICFLLVILFSMTMFTPFLYAKENNKQVYKKIYFSSKKIKNKTDNMSNNISLSTDTNEIIEISFYEFHKLTMQFHKAAKNVNKDYYKKIRTNFYNLYVSFKELKYICENTNVNNKVLDSFSNIQNDFDSLTNYLLKCRIIKKAHLKELYSCTIYQGKHGKIREVRDELP
ncbi:MAG: hypothetical protein KAI43_02555 [Candidatus Aureabacteria bacterium]|nr:hypothetical protein [Candidatus Auribacterota bacterium]